MLLVIPNKVDSATFRLHRQRVTEMEFHPTNDHILICGDEGPIVTFLTSTQVDLRSLFIRRLKTRLNSTKKMTKLLLTVRAQGKSIVHEEESHQRSRQQEGGRRSCCQKLDNNFDGEVSFGEEFRLQ